MGKPKTRRKIRSFLLTVLNKCTRKISKTQFISYSVLWPEVSGFSSSYEYGTFVRKTPLVFFNLRMWNTKYIFFCLTKFWGRWRRLIKVKYCIIIINWSWKRILDRNTECYEFVRHNLTVNGLLIEQHKNIGLKQVI